MDYSADEQTAARVIASLIYPDYPGGPDLTTHVNGLYGPAVNTCRDPYEMAAITMPKDGILRDCHGDAATAWEGLRQMSGAATPYAQLDPLIRSIGASVAPEKPILIGGELIDQPPAAHIARRYVLYTAKGLRSLPPVSWLINGEVPAGLTTLICGESEAGKSFLAVDYMMRTARKFPDRAVIYIAPEGGSGYAQRIEAWVNHYGGTEPENIYFILQSVTILNPQSLADLIATIRVLNPIMVVIDTLARTMVGGDENSAKDIGQFFYHTDILREQTGTAVLIIHHTGRSGKYRGSSSLVGSVDSWIDFANDDGLITVSCGKAKDWERFPPRYLRMVKSANSIVLLPSDQVDQRSDELSEGKRKILEALALDIFRGPGARRTEIASASGINEYTLYKVLSRMKRDGLINQSKKGDPYFISDHGLDAIRAYHRDLRLTREAEQLADAESENEVKTSNGVSQPANNGSLSNEQLATTRSTSNTTSNGISASSTKQLATSNHIGSPLGEPSTTSCEFVADSDELFPDDDLSSVLGKAGS